MKNRRTLIAVTALLAACTGGSVLWSPVACSCMEPWTEVAFGIGLDSVSNSSDLTASKTQSALAGKFMGVPAKASDLPDLGIPGTCIEVGPVIECNWWLWESLGREKGLRAVLTRDDKTVVREVTVKDVFRAQSGGT